MRSELHVAWPVGEQANALKKKELELQAREAQLERSLKELQRQRDQVAPRNAQALCRARVSTPHARMQGRRAMRSPEGWAGRHQR